MTVACSRYGHEGYEVLPAISKKVQRGEWSERKRKRSKCIWPGSENHPTPHFRPIEIYTDDKEPTLVSFSQYTEEMKITIVSKHLC